MILSLAALARALATKASIWLVLALVAALCGILTYSTAIYALIAVLVVSVAALMWRPLRAAWPKPTIIAVLVACVFVLAALLIYRSHPQGHPPLSFAPLPLISFVLIYLGNALPLPTRLHPLGGLLLLTAGGVSIWRLVKLGHEKENLFFWTSAFPVWPVQRPYDRNR